MTPSISINNSDFTENLRHKLNSNSKFKNWEDICQKTYESAHEVLKEDLTYCRTNRPTSVSLGILSAIAVSSCILMQDDQLPIENILTSALKIAFPTVGLAFLFCKVYGNHEAKKIEYSMHELNKLKTDIANPNFKSKFFNYISTKRDFDRENLLTCYELVDYYGEYKHIEKFT